MRVLAHLLPPLLVLHLSAARQAFVRFFLFPTFRRTFLAPPPAPVSAPGQILFPVEFKTPRNTRIYFTGVPRAAGRDERQRKEGWEGKGRGGTTRFYSGSDEARKRNKEKMYTRETREAAQTRTQGEERRRPAKGVGERVGSSKLLYLGRSPLSERSGRYYFSKTTSSTSNPTSSFFPLSLFFLILFLPRLVDFYDSNDRPVNE